MKVTRRRFAALLGLLAVGGVTAVAGAAESLPKGDDSKSDGHSKDKEQKGEHKSAAGPDKIWTDLMEGNKRFVAGKQQAREFIRAREELTKGQHPQVIVLSCSDSRVAPELVFDKSLGDLFVVRTAGNIADPVALGSIEYAAEHLHAKLLVVLGHEKCGAVAAAASGEKMPSPNLEAIVKKIAPALEKLKASVSRDLLLIQGVDANVHQSAKDIVEASPILKKEIAAGKLKIIKAVYRLKSGEVVRLA